MKSQQTGDRDERGEECHYFFPVVAFDKVTFFGGCASMVVG